MRLDSLSTRLFAATLAGIVLAVAVAGFGLTRIFDRAIERRAATELRNELRFLAGELRFEPGGAVALERNPADPRYDQPYGGRYWQIDAEGREPVRSRSLWDTALTVPSLPLSGEISLATLPGPGHQTLGVVMQSITVPDGQRDRVVRLAVGFDRAELDAERIAFLQMLVPSLATLAIFLAVAMWLFQRLALRPLGNLRKALARVHQDKAKRIEGEFPAELRPLVEDLNRVISHRETDLERTRTRAGELAHGLKTPLAVLDAVARDLHLKGLKAAATEVREQVDAMNRHVRHALARARTAIADPLRARRTPIRPAAERVVNALSRLPDADRLSWQIDLAGTVTAPFDAADLTEILGTLLDNARKWAQHRIVLRAREVGGTLVLDVEDDGPGILESEAPQILQGQRFDDAKSGSGLGLSIVRDLAEALGGHLELGRSAIGGLQARIVVVPS
jgi:signal transduction histidine kinase